MNSFYNGILQRNYNSFVKVVPLQCNSLIMWSILMSPKHSLVKGLGCTLYFV